MVFIQANMNNIERFKQLEKQITWVERELKKGEYKAAGLGVDITIGEDGEYMSMSFGIYSGIEQELLELLLRGLKETKEYVLKDILNQQKEISQFIETL